MLHISVLLAKTNFLNTLYTKRKVISFDILYPYILGIQTVLGVQYAYSMHFLNFQVSCFWEASIFIVRIHAGLRVNPILKIIIVHCNKVHHMHMCMNTYGLACNAPIQ